MYSVYEAPRWWGRSPRQGWAGVVGLSEGAPQGRSIPGHPGGEPRPSKEDNLTQLVQVCMDQQGGQVLAVPVEDSSGLPPPLPCWPRRKT